MADAEKTEQPTPEKRRRAREEGQFARGKDAGGVAASAAVLLVLLTLGGTFASAVHAFALRCFTSPYGVTPEGAGGPLTEFGGVLLAVTLPPALAAAIGAAAIGFAEAGFHPQLSLIMPKASRIGGFSRLGEMFAPQKAVVEILFSAARVAAVAYVAYSASRDALPRIISLSRGNLLSATQLMGEVFSTVVIKCTIALGVLAGGDYIYNRWKLGKQLMMSRQEIKDEQKQSEGDPRTKARMRQRAREMLRKGISKAVPQADVVVVNPTHVSVALRYRPKDGAPIVVAKGYDEIALYIRTLARSSGVPILENKPLARALASRVRIGKAIPADLFAAVAEVLAFVYRIKGRAAAFL
jgi:flagellar biosynthetic protein FlhB